MSYPPYPGQPAYPPAPGQPPYPPQAYPPQAYPAQAPPGYPPQAAGYPPYPPAPGYPPQPYAAYPPAPAQQPYPPAPAGYPQAAPGYPPYQQAPYGAPPPQPGYPPAQPPPAAYPSAPPAAAYGQPAPGAYQSGPPQAATVVVVTGAQGAPKPAMSAEIYAPTVKPDPHFNASKDCEVLRKAMKGIGTDEGALIGVLCNRSWQQRAEIEKTYQQMFGKILEKEIGKETSGNFRKVLERLLKTPVELAAFELHQALCGAGTDEECLVEIICTKGNEELRAIEHKYQEMYHKSLEKDISGDTSGYFRRLLISLLSCNRPADGPVDWVAAAVDAKALYEAGAKHAGTDEARFNAILAGRSYSQLRAIFEVYHKEYKKDISEVIKAEFSGHIANALLAVVACIRNRSAYFANRLHAAMAGAGTRDEMLLRIIVMRADFDLGAIKAEYLRMHGKPLGKAVHEDTSGDYKKSLIAIIQD